MNQTVVAEDDAQFRPMGGVIPGTQRFNDSFGDCYVSGTINVSASRPWSMLMSVRFHYWRRIQRHHLHASVGSIKGCQRYDRVSFFASELVRLDRLISTSIKRGLRSAKGATEFTLDMDSSSSQSINSELLKDTETTITVSWMGGGQVKARTYLS